MEIIIIRVVPEREGEKLSERGSVESHEDDYDYEYYYYYYYGHSNNPCHTKK